VQHFRILVAAHKIRKIAKLLSGPPLAPVLYVYGKCRSVIALHPTKEFLFGYLTTLFQLRKPYSFDLHGKMIKNSNEARIWKKEVVTYFSKFLTLACKNWE
jgi:hypothetical protein